MEFPSAHHVYSVMEPLILSNHLPKKLLKIVEKLKLQLNKIAVVLLLVEKFTFIRNFIYLYLIMVID